MTDDQIDEMISIMCQTLDEAKYEKSFYEDFVETFIDDIKTTRGSEDALCARWKANEYASQTAVMLLRLLTSSYLQSHSDDFMAFITDDLLSNDVSQNPMKLYCQRNVECMGVESDQVHIVALCNLLRCSVSIIYLDNSFSEDTDPLVLGEQLHDVKSRSSNPAGLPKANIHMLYRPGHYDLIYPRTKNI